jgi:hypothetical protein
MSVSSQNSISQDGNEYTCAVKKAYFQIIGEVSQLIKSFEISHLETLIVLSNQDSFKEQFLSPFIHIRLSNDLTKISFAIDLELSNFLGAIDYIKLIRVIFQETSREKSSILIEDCLEQVEYFYADFEDALVHENAIILQNSAFYLTLKF